MRQSIVNLSLVQTLGVAITAAGGAAVWFVAAALAPAADLGTLGRVVSTGTLVSGLVTSGLGQFLLVIARTSDGAQLRRYVIGSLVAGGLLSFVATLALGAVQGAPSAVMIGAALLALGIAITNLQDAAYLSTGMSYDVPLKGFVIILARLILLALIAAGVQQAGLLLVFVGSQLLVGCGWTARLATALRRHALRAPEPRRAMLRPLAVSYVYASSVACVTSGVPALITSVVSPAEAGAFYLTWTVAGLMGGGAVAVANAVLVVSDEMSVQRVGRMLSTLLALLASASALLVLAAPLLVSVFHRELSGANALLGRLLGGQIGFGMVVGALAVLRRARPTAPAATQWLTLGALALWPTLVIGGVWLGLRAGLDGAGLAFTLGNALAACGVCSVALWSAWAGERHPDTTTSSAALLAHSPTVERSTISKR